MKKISSVVLLSLFFAACDDYRKPQPDGRPDGGLNPSEVGNGASLEAGQFAVTVIDNASLFNELPMGSVLPDLYLPKDTSVRVIAPGELYCKVELDNGRVGYVTSTQLMGLSKSGSAGPGGHGPTLPGGGGGTIDPHLPPIEP